MRSLLLAPMLATSIAALAACGDDPQHFVDAGPIDAAGHDAEASCGTAADALPVYLNRGGGTYSGGDEDPATNHTSIVKGVVTVSPYTVSEPAWAELRACVETYLAPFKLRVTEVDPGTADHLEIVFAGNRSTELLGASGVTEVSPSSCAVSRDSIHFVFPAELPAPPPALLCKLAAQAVGHAATLDFTPDCSDIMAYGLGSPTCSGAGGFTDSDLDCGTTEPAGCACNGDTFQRNSFLTMVAAYGRCE